MLKVGIHGDDAIAAGAAQPGAKRRLVPEIPGQADILDPLVRARCSLDNVKRCVGAAVVHDNYFVQALRKRASNLIEQARARARAAGVLVRFDEGDAESLPYEDAEFDLVVSLIGAMFASDLGHWDVPDATGVLPEAFELVERGLVTTDDFRAFTHDHALALWGPRLFADTVLASR